MRVYSMRPSGVLNAVYWQSDSLHGMFQKADPISHVVNLFAFPSFSSESSMRGKGNESFFIN